MAGRRVCIHLKSTHNLFCNSLSMYKSIQQEILKESTVTTCIYKLKVLHISLDPGTNF